MDIWHRLTGSAHLCAMYWDFLGLFAAWWLSRTCSTYFWMRADRVMETLFFRRWRLSSQNCRARFSVMPDRICSSFRTKLCLCFTYKFTYGYAACVKTLGTLVSPRMASDFGENRFWSIPICCMFSISVLHQRYCFAQMGLAPSLPECVSAAFCTSEMWGSLFRSFQI